MKKAILLVIIIAFIGCKNNTKSEESHNHDLESTENHDHDSERTEKQSDGLTLLKGEFIFYGDAAVLQTHKEVYAVVIDDKMHELNEQVKQFKNADTDMVPVELRGIITSKPENEEGWPFRVEIKEILNVSKPEDKAGEMITIGKE